MPPMVKRPPFSETPVMARQIFLFIIRLIDAADDDDDGEEEEDGDDGMDNSNDDGVTLLIIKRNYGGV